MTQPLRLFCTILLAALLVVACGGGDEPTTTVSPEPVSVESVTSSSDPAVPEFATAVAGQLASLTMQALRQAVGVPPVGFGASGSRRLSANGSFRVDCPAGGYMEMTQLPDRLPFIGEVGLSGVREVYKACSYTEHGNNFTTNGELTLNGKYHIAENVPRQINADGDLSTTPGEDCPVVGKVTADHAYAGTICAWPISTLALTPPTPQSPAELLTGHWSGPADFTNPDFGCKGVADVTFHLSGSGESIQGDFSFTITDSRGSNPGCSLSCSEGGPIGCGSGDSLSGTARDGAIDLSGGGLTFVGDYHPRGRWMGGPYSGNADGFAVTGDLKATK